MDKLTPFLKTFGLVIIATVAVLLFFVFYGVKKRCTFEIRNEGPTALKVKIFKYDRDQMHMGADSVSVGVGETFEIGRCINCIGPDSTHFDFDAIALSDSSKNFRFMHAGELLRFLATKEQEGCVTWVLK